MISSLESWINLIVKKEKSYWNTKIEKDGIYLFPITTQSSPWKHNSLSFSIQTLILPYFKSHIKQLEILESLVFSALTHSPQEITFESPPHFFWDRINLLPQPCFSLTKTISLAPEIEKALPVKEPLKVQWSHSINFEGTVLDHLKKPIAFEKITLVKSRHQTLTNKNGEFIFDSLPRSDDFPKIEVRGKAFTTKSKKLPAIYKINLLETHLNA